MSLDDDVTGADSSAAGRGVDHPTCTNCGERGAPAAHTFRFERPDRADRVIDLQVCDRCLEAIASEAGVERL